MPNFASIVVEYGANVEMDHRCRLTLDSRATGSPCSEETKNDQVI